jgi:hypothetical protein
VRRFAQDDGFARGLKYIWWGGAKHGKIEKVTDLGMTVLVGK